MSTLAMSPKLINESAAYAEVYAVALFNKVVHTECDAAAPVIESSVIPRAVAAAAPDIEPPAQTEGDPAAPAIKTLVHAEDDA